MTEATPFLGYDPRLPPLAVKEIDGPDSFPPAVLDPFDVERRPLVANTRYRFNRLFPPPRFWVPTVTTPGTLEVIIFEGVSPGDLNLDMAGPAYFYGRDVGGLVFNFLGFHDISNGGIGGSVNLFDLVGGNGPSSFLSFFQSSLITLRSPGKIVDMGLNVGTQTASIGNRRGWTMRCNPGQCSGHFVVARQFSGLGFLPDNPTASLSFLGQTDGATVLGNTVGLAKPGNAFVFIDEGTSTGSYAIGLQNYPGTSQGAFFRPDVSDAISEQTDASIAVSLFSDSAVAPGVDTTVSFAEPVDLNRGQTILIVGGTYAGTYAVTRVALDHRSLDIVGAFVGASAGTLGQTVHTVALNHFVRGETVTISGTTNYNATARVLSATDTTFTTPQEFLGDDAAGTAESSGRDQTSPGVAATGNGAQPDSTAKAEVCWNGNAEETTVADGTPGPMALTGVMLASGERFGDLDEDTGEVTYLGKRPISLTVRVNITGSTTDSSLNAYRVKVALDQIAVGAAYSTLEIRTTSVQVMYQAIIDVVEGSQIRVEIEGQGTTQATTIIEGQIILEI